MLKLKRADYDGTYHGFTLKEGYYYGINTETGNPIATSGWECAGNLCLYSLNDGKWEKEWVGIEENDFDISPLPDFSPVGKMSFLEWLEHDQSLQKSGTERLICMKMSMTNTSMTVCQNLSRSICNLTN